MDYQYEILKDSPLSGRECLIGHKMSGKPNYKYTDSGVRRIMKSTIQTGDFRGRLRIREIRKVYLKEGGFELWATPVETHSVYYPLECVWYPIIPMRASTRDHLDTL